MKYTREDVSFRGTVEGRQRARTRLNLNLVRKYYSVCKLEAASSSKLPLVRFGDSEL